MSGMGGGGVRAGGGGSKHVAATRRKAPKAYGKATATRIPPPQANKTPRKEKKKTKARRGRPGKAQRGQTAILTRVRAGGAPSRSSQADNQPPSRQHHLRADAPLLATHAPSRGREHYQAPPAGRLIRSLRLRVLLLPTSVRRAAPSRPHTYYGTSIAEDRKAPGWPDRTQEFFLFHRASSGQITINREDNGGVMDRWASARAIFLRKTKSVDKVDHAAVARSLCPRAMGAAVPALVGLCRKDASGVTTDQTSGGATP
jgi:hypothetical protein